MRSSRGIEMRYIDARQNINECAVLYKMSEVRYVTFTKIPNARTGNILFQYLFAVTISLKYGHKYIAVEDFQTVAIPSSSVSIYKITDANYADFDKTILKTSHIICEGFFQRDEHFIEIRERLLEYLKCTDDYWFGFSGNREYVREFFTSRHSVELKPSDIVMSLRLDDFIQLPNPRSDIVPPRFYMDILETWFSTEGREAGRLFIVSDKIKLHWEHKYLEFFQKWSPTLIQNTLMHDCALMRDCAALIHSNSTLCWLMSFFSEKTHRFIPITGTYSSQHLEVINQSTDKVWHVQPLSHSDVYGLNVMCDHRDIQSLPYCIPNEIFVDSPLGISDKKYVVAPLIPGDASNYLFGAGEDTKYYNMYNNSAFALTKKKGGWDCLRHYEILANGCIPIFEDLNKCPADTLSSFPKELLAETYKTLLPWKNAEEQREAYNVHSAKLLEFAKTNCSVSATAGHFLQNMAHLLSNRRDGASNPPHILMLVGHLGVNYTRELTWIGIKRWAKTTGSTAVEWPPLDYLYDDFPETRLKELYGNGFTYSRRLSADSRHVMTETELIASIKEKRWDMIIYGKVGPDEMAEGSVPNLPFWEHVFKRYSRDEIAFWYGGDGMQDMTYANRYSDHLVRHCQYARCFVRELIRWNGVF